MISDLRFAFRQLGRSPGFAAVVLLTLAVGIGLNTAMFSLINATFLRALPYPDADRLLHVSERNARGNMSVSYPNFQDWQKQQTAFEHLAFCGGESETLKTDDLAEPVSAALISADFFRVLGAQVLHGRSLRADDDLPASPQVAWLSYGAWQRLFAGSPSVVGKTIQLEGEPATIAGILPPTFSYIRRYDLFRPVAPLAETRYMNMRVNHSNSHVIARMKRGVTVGVAAAELATIAGRLEQAYPESNAGVGVRVSQLRERISGSAGTQLLLLFGAVGAVLLIACVNVGNMLLARAMARRKEMAIRVALGASRLQLMRQLLIESLLLSVLGAAAGLLTGYWGADFASRLLPGDVRALFGEQVQLDWRVFAFVTAAAVLTGLFFGTGPAWKLSATDPNEALKATPQVLRTLFGRLHLGDLLVAAQVGLALVLLIASGLLIRSLHRLSQVDPGFEASQVLSLRLGAPPLGEFQKDAAAPVRYFQRIVDEVQALPEVEAAAVATSAPFAGSVSNMVFHRTDVPPPPAGAFPTANTHYVTDDYFRTMGIRLVRGRVFDGTERAPAVPAGVPLTPENVPQYYGNLVLTGVISQRMAEEIWPGEDALGKRFRLGMPSMNLPVVEVVGIVGNTTQLGLERGEQAEFYLPHRQFPFPFEMVLCVRPRMTPTAAAIAVTEAVRNASGGQPVYDLRTMSARIASYGEGRRFSMGLYTTFACVALLLSAIGIYGVLSFTVSRRTREIGIRMALGAQLRSVVAGVLLHVAAIAVPGAAAGLVAAWALGRILEGQLFAIGPQDPIAFLAALVLLASATMVAAWLPARRAARVNPTEALRSE